MGGKDDGRNVWEKPLIFHVVAEKWPFLFQIFPSKNRTFDFEKIEFPEKISLRACAGACARDRHPPHPELGKAI